MTAMETQTSLIASAVPQRPRRTQLWLTEHAQRGRDFFDAVSFATRKDEDWNETPLEALHKLNFARPKPVARAPEHPRL